MRLYLSHEGLLPITVPDEELFDALFQGDKTYTAHNQAMFEFILNHPKVLIAHRALSVATLERNNWSFNGGTFYLSECLKALNSLDTHIIIFRVQQGYQFYFRFADGFAVAPIVRPLLIDEYLADD